MRNALFLVALGSAAVLVGCAGPSDKLGRGLNNTFEFARLGEMRRSMEQTALWENPTRARTTGAIRGFNRSVARTFVGLYEVVTFPFPPFDPPFAPENKLFPDPSVTQKDYPYGGFSMPVDPVYPANNQPSFPAGPLMDTDSALGFSGGAVFSGVPGSQFKIFDQ